MEDRATLFEQHRSLLQGIAYRMTGTLTEAQDVVQDTWLRWSRARMEEVQDTRSWLVTACSRQALDVLKSARVQREQYFGVWLPEPLMEQDSAVPASQAEVDDSVSMALMLALEQLSPSERAAFLLHDVFGYGFDEVAGILGKSATSCRKLASRAREAVQRERPRFSVSKEDHQRLLEAFLKAAYAGDLGELKSLLADSVELRSDGGGKAQAVPDVLYGIDTVAAFLVRVLHDRPEALRNTQLKHCRVNGAPGVLIYENNQLVTALTLDTAEGVIRHIYAVRNPDKLGGQTAAAA